MFIQAFCLEVGEEGKITAETWLSLESHVYLWVSCPLYLLIAVLESPFTLFMRISFAFLLSRITRFMYSGLEHIICGVQWKVKMQSPLLKNYWEFQDSDSRTPKKFGILLCVGPMQQHRLMPAIPALHICYVFFFPNFFSYSKTAHSLIVFLYECMGNKLLRPACLKMSFLSLHTWM